VAPQDKSNGYEEISSAFISSRGQNRSGIGASTVARWSQALPIGASVLDLGCGTGIPITQTLLGRGFNVYAVDASPTIVSAFRNNFPKIPIACSAVEDSDFFARQFDVVIAWALIFLLDADAQRKLIARVSSVLPPGGRFLFTAPTQICTWQDAMTDRTCTSLGHEAYQEALETEGMSLTETFTDEGKNNYYSAIRITGRYELFSGR
jgi:SAM-dependent methyltransferase